MMRGMIPPFHLLLAVRKREEAFASVAGLVRIYSCIVCDRQKYQGGFVPPLLLASDMDIDRSQRCCCWTELSYG